MIPSISFNRSEHAAICNQRLSSGTKQPMRKRQRQHQRGRNKVSGSLLYTHGIDDPVTAYLAKHSRSCVEQHTRKLIAKVETCCDKPIKQIAVQEVGFEFSLQIDQPSPRNRHSVSYLTYYNERHALFVCLGKVCAVDHGDDVYSELGTDGEEDIEIEDIP